MRNVYIFDLDGTLAHCDWRLHLIKGTEKPDWGLFHLKSLEDNPVVPVMNILYALKHQNYEIWFWTARSEIARAVTTQWLQHHTGVRVGLGNLRMRAEGDRTKDHVLKPGWYDELSADDKKRVVGIFDDRKTVVDEYRKRGVQVFQVAEGNY